MQTFTVYATNYQRGVRGLVQRALRIPSYPVAMSAFHAPVPDDARAAAEAECARLKARKLGRRPAFASAYVVGTQVRTEDDGFAYHGFGER